MLVRIELIALGVINFVIGIFGGLPSFSALGRSKINLIAGATSPMSGLIMSGSSIIALFYLLSYLFYLPECVLAFNYYYNWYYSITRSTFRFDILLEY